MAEARQSELRGGATIMRLLITDPTAVVVDHADVTSLRAEDESGSFGILAGSCRPADGAAGLGRVLAACRRQSRLLRGAARGVECARRRQIAIATREAQRGDDLDTLEASVLTRFRAEAEAERAGRVAATRLHTQAIRRIVDALRPERQQEIGA